MDEASSMVYKDFANSIALRREFYQDYESFIAYLADGQLVVMQVDEHGWELFNAVPIAESLTLMG